MSSNADASNGMQNTFFIALPYRRFAHNEASGVSSFKTKTIENLKKHFQLK